MSFDKEVNYLYSIVNLSLLKEALKQHLDYELDIWTI